MSSASLPTINHIVRYARPKQVDRGTVDGTAFILRENEPGLSVNWLEVFGTNSDHNAQLQEVRRLFRLTLSVNGRFAKLNVGQTQQLVSAGAKEAGISLALDVVSVPSPQTHEFEKDPSHAEIIGVPARDSDEAIVIGDLISECVLYPLYPGKVA